MLLRDSYHKDVECLRQVFVLLLALLLLLGGCAAPSAPMELATDFRAQLCNAGGCSFQAEITAEYETYHTTFTLQCGYDTQTQQLTFSLLAPASIQDISGCVSADRKTVNFDNVSLQMPLLAAQQLAPVALPQVLAQSWASAYIAAAGSEQDYYVILYQNGYEAEALQVETWFSDGKPVYAAVWYEDVSQAGVKISNFSFRT